MQSQDGAASAFADLALWTVLSPAARQDPQAAVKSLGANVLNPSDAEQLTSMSRSDGDQFQLGDGAYRILGYSGDATKPDQVMVEVTAPLTLSGHTRWAVVGGVVNWADGFWQVTSMAPRTVAGVPDDTPPVGVASDVDGGDGWKSFSSTAQE